MILKLSLIFILSELASSAILKPRSSGELQQMLDTARQGDTIQLQNMVYRGDFTANQIGPVVVQGDYNSTIESEGDFGMHVRGNGWKLNSFWIKGPSIGLLMEGSKNSANGLIFERTRRAVVVRGEDNTIKGCVISQADTGIHMEGSRNNLLQNSVNIQTPAIIIDPGTCCGVLDGNVCNGEMNIDGDNYKLKGNVANHGLYVKGCNNEFKGNVANGASFPDHCPSIDKGGNSYRGLGPDDTDPPQANKGSGQGQFNQFSTGPSGQSSPHNFGQQASGGSGSSNFNSGPSGGGGGGNPQGQGQRVPTQVISNTGDSSPKCTCTCG